MKTNFINFEIVEIIIVQIKITSNSQVGQIIGKVNKSQEKTFNLVAFLYI